MRRSRWWGGRGGRGSGHCWNGATCSIRHWTEIHCRIRVRRRLSAGVHEIVNRPIFLHEDPPPSSLHTQALTPNHSQSYHYYYHQTGMELTITDAATVLSDAYEGCSIAVNGVCLTVVTFTRTSSFFGLSFFS